MGDENSTPRNEESMVTPGQLLMASHTRTRITIDDLPPEIILKVFQVLRVDCIFHDFQIPISDPLDPKFVVDTPYDSFTTSICLALTCHKHWEIFAEMWCDPGTLRMPALTLPQAMILRTTLQSWVPTRFRPSSQHRCWDWTPMFFSTEVYGDGRRQSREEIGVFARHSARRMINRGNRMSVFPRSTNTVSQNTPTPSSQFVRFPSPQGMGEDWYLAAAVILRDLWLKWYHECHSIDGDIAPRRWMERSWAGFRITILYPWAYGWRPIETNWGTKERVYRSEIGKLQRLVLRKVDLSYVEEHVRADLRGLDTIISAWYDNFFDYPSSMRTDLDFNI